MPQETLILATAESTPPNNSARKIPKEVTAKAWGRLWNTYVDFAVFFARGQLPFCFSCENPDRKDQELPLFSHFLIKSGLIWEIYSIRYEDLRPLICLFWNYSISILKVKQKFR